jgi:hypothetical protein
MTESDSEEFEYSEDNWFAIQKTRISEIRLAVEKILHGKFGQVLFQSFGMVAAITSLLQMGLSYC